MTRRIYLIDDDESDSLFFMRAVNRCDDRIHVTWFDSVQGAIDALQKDASANTLPALIVCDMKMPAMTGMDFLRKRQGTAFARVPVIIWSGGNFRDEMQEAKELGAKEWLVKPGGFDALMEQARTICDLMQRLNEAS